MLGILLASAAAASSISPEAAIRDYCEPLIAGASAERLKSDLINGGFKQEVLVGQQVLRQGELIIGLSADPRVCFVQAPVAVTAAEGFAMADRWAKRHIGAIRSSVTKGPDGSPVRGWSDLRRGVALIASQQTAPSGQKLMAFIVMPVANRTGR
ncbi:MAG TPA: hypothetical protein VGC35_11725 [Allosphingosinicella sp.]